MAQPFGSGIVVINALSDMGKKKPKKKTYAFDFTTPKFKIGKKTFKPKKIKWGWLT